jgi:phosphoglycerol transferase MdoB-like AlkP superfamily enzyme
MVAVQSESFFDPRRLYSGIRPDLLAEFDRIKAGSRAWGSLRVPAWGANTIRTELSFLTGVDNALLGAHRFNPYRALARGWEVLSLPAFLRSVGYRTICIHPYFRSFYQRDKVMPRLGFDEFLGIESFADVRQSGPYIGDAAVADLIAETLKSASRPTFVFAITMENHGPLHLEKVGQADERELYSSAPPENFEDLTVYLRHVRNADVMIGALTASAATCDRPMELCWYGDHVPIMPKVYEALGTPCGDVEYVLWNSGQAGIATQQDAGVEQLAMKWLVSAGLLD